MFLERLVGLLAGAVLPQDLDQAGRAHGVRNGSGQCGQQETLLGARHRDRRGVVREHLQRSEDRDTHAPTIGGTGPDQPVSTPPGVSRGRSMRRNRTLASSAAGGDRDPRPLWHAGPGFLGHARRGTIEAGVPPTGRWRWASVPAWTCLPETTPP